MILGKVKRLCKEAPRQTIKRSLDEPKLEIGETDSIRKGVAAVVLARAITSAQPPLTSWAETNVVLTAIERAQAKIPARARAIASSMPAS